MDLLREDLRTLNHINDRMRYLRTALGIELQHDQRSKHTLTTLRSGVAAADLEALEHQFSARTSTPTPIPTPAAALPMVSAPDPRPVELTGSPMLDKAIADSGCHSLAQYRAARHLDELIDAVGGLPAGPTRLCLESKIHAAKAHLESLT